MKSVFTPITFTTALILSCVWLVSEPIKPLASQEALGVEQVNQLMRVLIPQRSQDFFRDRLEQEIQHLQQRQNAEDKPILKDTENVQSELERLPQLQPNELTPLNQ